jgi:hypothetical protein
MKKTEVACSKVIIRTTIDTFLTENGIPIYLVGNAGETASIINCCRGPKSTGKKINANAEIATTYTNVKTKIVPSDYIVLRARRKINAGEEILIDYGEGFWDNDAITAGCDKCFINENKRNNKIILCDTAGCCGGSHQDCSDPL